MHSDSWILFALLAVLGAGIVFFARRWLREAQQNGQNLLSAFFSPGVFFSAIFFLLFVAEPLFVRMFPEGSSRYVASLSDAVIFRHSITATIFAIIAFAAFAIGYEVRCVRGLAQRLPVARINHADPIGIALVIVVCLVICCVGFYIFGFRQYAGLLIDSQDRAVATAGLGYVFFLIEFGGTGILIAYLFSVREDSTVSPWRAVLWLMPLLYMGFGRTDVAQIWLAMLVIRAQQKARRRPLSRLAIVAACVALPVLVGLGHAYRVANHGGRGDFRVFDERSVYSIRHILVTYDHFLAYLDMPETRPGELYGRTVIDTLVMLLPTSLVGEKPLTLGNQLMPEMYAMANGGTPFTLVGVLHANGGIIAIIVGMFVIGMGLRTIYSYFLLNRKEKSVLLLYSFFIGRFFLVVWGTVEVGMIGYIKTLLQLVMIFSILMLARKPNELHGCINLTHGNWQKHAT